MKIEQDRVVFYATFFPQRKLRKEGAKGRVGLSQICDKKHLWQFLFCVSEKDFAEVKKKASI